MADSKITDLTALTAVAETDVLAVVDVSATETKKATKAVLLAPITANGTNVGIGTTAPTALLTLGATTPRLDFLESGGSSGFDNTALVRDADVFATQTRNGATFVSNDYRMTANASGATKHEWRIANSEKMHLDSTGLDVSSGSVLLNGNELNGVKVTIADDAAAALTFPTREGGFLFVGINVNSVFPQITNFSVSVPVDFGQTPGYPPPLFQGSGVEMNNAAALTGTTGTDGKVTIGTAGVDGTLYIENRTGSSYQFSVTLL
tara:strand:+ start:1921 stop:2709 length:789 start_codon:yes stop_codon:yes gene_type:complete